MLHNIFLREGAHHSWFYGKMEWSTVKGVSVDLRSGHCGN